MFADCGIPANPTNGRVDVNKGTGLGDRAAYTCNAGYYVTGDYVRLCLPNNTWAGTQPSCIIYGNLKFPFVFVLTNKRSFIGILVFV